MGEANLTNFTVRQAAETCGLTKMMIAYLVRHSIVKPSASRYRRRGKKLLFSFQDLIVLRTVRSLLEKGISASRLASEIKSLRQQLKRIDPDELKSEFRFLVTDGSKIYFWNRQKDVYPFTSGGQLAFAFVVDLQPIHAEVRDRAKKAKSSLKTA